MNSHIVEMYITTNGEKYQKIPKMGLAAINEKKQKTINFRCWPKITNNDPKNI